MNRLSDSQKYACNVAGLYLSLYDNKAYEKLSEGSTSQKKIHEYLALKFKVSPNFIKIVRDEFDFHIDNSRVGFKRSLSKEKSDLLNKYKPQDEKALYEELEKVLNSEYITKKADIENIKINPKINTKQIKIKQFTILGNNLFKEFFSTAEDKFKNDNKIETVPIDLLISEENADEFEFSGNIELNKKFKNRYELGHYLYTVLKDCDVTQIYNNEYLWNWISASLFSSLFPSPRGGGQEIRYILSNNFMYHYRHICYYSWLLFYNLKENSKVLLTSPANSISDDYEQISSNRKLLNINFINLLTEMYLIEDTTTGSIRFKKGVNATKKNIPGTVRRLKTIYKRLSSNYYIENMKYRDFKNSVIEFSDEFDQHLN